MLDAVAHQQVIYLKDHGAGPALLDCGGCVDAAICGGLHLPAGAIDSCLTHCTCKPEEMEACDVVCPRVPKNLVRRIREVATFNFENIPKTKKLQMPLLPAYVPIVHGSAARKGVEVDYIAIPFSRALVGRGANTRARSSKELVEATGVRPRIGWILSGTQDDRSVERVWDLGSRLRPILEDIQNAGVIFATTPNFSLYCDVPRHDNLHAMKRIAWIWHHMQQAGIPTALHINGRTDHDFFRWAEFARQRPSVQSIAFEFGTGALPLADRARYVERLKVFAAMVKRPMSLVLRGSADVVADLRGSFSKVTLLDSTAYQRAVHRREAFVDGNGQVRYNPVATTSSRQVASLFANNNRVMRAAIELDIESLRPPQGALDFWAKPTTASKAPINMNADNESLQLDMFTQQPLCGVTCASDLE